MLKPIDQIECEKRVADECFEVLAEEYHNARFLVEYPERWEGEYDERKN